jgi:hypothetical protein
MKNLRDILVKEKKKLYDYQQGNVRPIRTTRPYLQEPWEGLLPKSCIVIGGHSSAGKSYELDLLMGDILDVDLNPDAKDYVWLNFSLEMPLFSLMVRYLSKVLQIPKEKVILSKFTEEQNRQAREALEAWQDGRYFLQDEPTGPNEYFQLVDDFCSNNLDKKAIFISIDHVVLLDSDGNTTSSVNSVLRHTNTLKLKYDNVYFIYLSQLSSNFFSRLDERNNHSAPKDTDTFYSAQLNQVADYTIIIVNPFQLGINEWLRFSPDRYPHLSKYFGEEDVKNNKTSFYTEGLLFYHVVKNREANRGYTNLFVHELYPRVEKLVTAAEKVDYMSKSAKKEWESLMGKKIETGAEKMEPNRNINFDDFEIPF